MSATVITGASCRLLSEEELNEIIEKELELAIQKEVEENQNTGEDESPFFDNSIDHLDKIKIFPNPVNIGQEMNIQIPEESGIEQLLILNSNGQAVKNIAIKNMLESKFNIGNLSSGMYFVQFIGNTLIEPKRFIVNN